MSSCLTHCPLPAAPGAPARGGHRHNFIGVVAALCHWVCPRVYLSVGFSLYLGLSMVVHGKMEPVGRRELV